MPKRGYTKGWNSVRNQAYKRDLRAQAPCHICGQPIDYQAPMDSPDSYQADHVLPVKDFPQYELDLNNIKASHASCNKAKADKEKHNSIGQRSRSW